MLNLMKFVNHERWVGYYILYTIYENLKYILYWDVHENVSLLHVHISIVAHPQLEKKKICNAIQF